jgi:hypothetical protein
MVDEGKKDFSGGGTAAAPAFKDFASMTLPMLAIRPKLEAEKQAFKIQEAGGYASFGFNW